MRYILLIVALLLSVSTAKANAQVIISEIYPAPLSGESEWIELVNVGTEPVDITGWNLWDQLASPSLLYTFTEPTILPSKSFRVMALPSQKLNNSGDAVLLYDPAVGVADEVWFTSINNGKSWQRVSASGEQFISADPTPGAENSTYPLLSQPSPTPTPTPSPTPTSVAATVTLTEFSACPAGGNEWIELYNTAESITFNNWVIRDDVGNQRKISGELPPYTFTRFEWSGAILRNTGDSFSVFTDTGEKIGSATYDSCQTGSTHVFDGTNWIQVIPDEIRQNSPLPSSSPTTKTSTQTAQSQTASTSAQPASQSAVFATIPTPKLSFPPYKPENLATKAMKLKTILSMPTPTIPYIPLLSVILGGLLVLIPGLITLYANHRRSPPPQ